MSEKKPSKRNPLFYETSTGNILPIMVSKERRVLVSLFIKYRLYLVLSLNKAFPELTMKWGKPDVTRCEGTRHCSGHFFRPVIEESGCWHHINDIQNFFTNDNRVPTIRRAIFQGKTVNKKKKRLQYRGQDKKLPSRVIYCQIDSKWPSKGVFFISSPLLILIVFLPHHLYCNFLRIIYHPRFSHHRPKTIKLSRIDNFFFIIRI